ncbi:MAG: hypothetical protein AB2813_02805 [Candidatus Sedimenticola endophacoides]
MFNRHTIFSTILFSSSTTGTFAHELEFGSRLWLSKGETEWSHCASPPCGGGFFNQNINGNKYTVYLGDPTSKLNYSDTNATVYEVFANYRADNFLTMAKIGTGTGDGGYLRDQDWFSTTNGDFRNTEYSDTLSEIKNTDVGYLMVDFGYSLNFSYKSTPSEQSFQIIPFIGYFNYDEKLNAYGLIPVIDGDINQAEYESDQTNVISNEVNWSGIRLGAVLETELDEKIKLNVNIAYAIVDTENKDSHLLRVSEFGPAPNVLGKGDGGGVMLDLLLNYHHDAQLDFEIGYRYWDLDTDSATGSTGPDFSHTYPIRSLYSIRSGLLIGAKYKF